MKEKELHTIKSSGFKVPNDYFEGLEDAVLTQVKLNEHSDISGLKVPKDYFETFEVTVIKDSVAQKETKVIPLYKRKTFAFISSIAAAVVLFLLIPSIFNSTLSIDNLDTATIDNYILNEADAYDLAALFQENELSEMQFIDYNFNEESIDSYLENVDVNELIIE